MVIFKNAQILPTSSSYTFFQFPLLLLAISLYQISSFITFLKSENFFLKIYLLFFYFQGIIQAIFHMKI